MQHFSRRHCLSALAAGAVAGALPAGRTRAQDAATTTTTTTTTTAPTTTAEGAELAAEPVQAPERTTSMTSPTVPMSFALRGGSLVDLQHDRDAVRIERVLPAPPLRVFTMLGAAEPWPKWLHLVKQVAYLDDKRGVGCERDVKLYDDSVIREHFIAWSPERVAFYVTRSSSPALSFFMEDFVLLPIAGGRTRLRWTVAYELAGAHTLLTPAYGPVFQQQAEAGLDRLTAMLLQR
ncbi:MAG TPA: SRPBCC family protein [Myxococcota bacterium]